MSEDDRGRLEIGERIKQLRLAKTWTIKELAQHAGMSAGYLSEVERGGSALSGEKFGALAKLLGTTVDYILTGAGEVQHAGAEIRIPAGLAEAAQALDLSYATTMRLLHGKKSLVAARRESIEDEWTAQRWIEFFENVKPYL